MLSSHIPFFTFTVSPARAAVKTAERATWAFSARARAATSADFREVSAAAFFLLFFSFWRCSAAAFSEMRGRDQKQLHNGNVDGEHLVRARVASYASGPLPLPHGAALLLPAPHGHAAGGRCTLPLTQAAACSDENSLIQPCRRGCKREGATAYGRSNTDLHDLASSRQKGTYRHVN